jgi:hypothetical protein
LALAYGSFAVLTSPGMKVKLSNVLLTFQLFVRRRQCNFNRSKSCVKATYGLHGAFQTVFLSLQIDDEAVLSRRVILWCPLLVLRCWSCCVWGILLCDQLDAYCCVDVDANCCDADIGKQRDQYT